MGTQEFELERAGEKSAVDGSDPVCILDHESSGRVTHDSHKLQAKAINHATRHYMNRRELESNRPIDVPSLCVLSFPPSAQRSASVQYSRRAIAGRRAPHLATTRKDTARQLQLFCTALHAIAILVDRIRIQRLVITRTVRIEAVQAATRAECEAAQIAVRPNDARV